MQPSLQAIQHTSSWLEVKRKGRGYQNPEREKYIESAPFRKNSNDRKRPVSFSQQPPNGDVIHPHIFYSHVCPGASHIKIPNSHVFLELLTSLSSQSPRPQTLMCSEPHVPLHSTPRPDLSLSLVLPPRVKTMGSISFLSSRTQSLAVSFHVLTP